MHIRQNAVSRRCPLVEIISAHRPNTAKSVPTAPDQERSTALGGISHYKNIKICTYQHPPPCTSPIRSIAFSIACHSPNTQHRYPLSCILLPDHLLCLSRLFFLYSLLDNIKLPDEAIGLKNRRTHFDIVVVFKPTATSPCVTTDALAICLFRTFSS